MNNEYEEIKNENDLLEKIGTSIKKYNVSKGTNLNLVLFKEAIHHLCRIHRVLNLPRGNLVLIGLGGCGK